MDEVRDTEEEQPQKELTIVERKFLVLCYEKKYQWQAYAAAVPGERTKRQNASNASVMMARIKHRGQLDEFLIAMGHDNEAVARIIVDAGKAVRAVMIGKDGDFIDVPDHQIRLKSAAMTIGIRKQDVGDGGENGGSNHLHIHLPGKVEDGEEWQAQTKERLEYIQKIQDLELQLMKANQKLEKYEA